MKNENNQDEISLETISTLSEKLRDKMVDIIEAECKDKNIFSAQSAEGVMFAVMGCLYALVLKSSKQIQDRYEVYTNTDISEQIFQETKDHFINFHNIKDNSSIN